MQDLPHRYIVSAAANSTDNVILSGDGLPDLESAAPAEFGGPGDQWSPESLLVAAIADCFILSFRAIASASRLEWDSLTCEAEGTLDRVERSMEFTAVTVTATLDVPAGTDAEKAARLLEKAESACLITSSLKAESHLTATVRVTGA